METAMLFVISLGVGIIGIYAVLRPGIVGGKISRFYSNYPLIRYAGEKQLSVRPAYVKAIGWVFIGMSIFMVIALFIQGVS